MVKQSSVRRKRSSKRKTSRRRRRSSKRKTSRRRRRSSKKKKIQHAVNNVVERNSESRGPRFHLRRCGAKSKRKRS